MSDEGGEGVWFRRRRYGLGYSASTWQGGVMTLVFVIILLVTVFAGDPNTARPSSVPTFLKVKAAMGLSGAHLSLPVMLALILGEVGAFLLMIWWKSRTLKPLD